MVNTRSKIKRTRTTPLRLPFPSPSADDDDSDQDFIPSAAAVASNDDLLTEILIRLPVRSVLRSKSVSKHWRSLISHPTFALRRPVSASPGLFLRIYHGLLFYIPFDIKNPISPPSQTLDFYPDLSGIKIVQSCNGLLLCCSDRGNERARKYYVFNPTTKQFAVLPSVPGGRDVRKNIRLMALAFDQTESPHYKVVCVHRAKENDELFQIEVYSSKTGKWRMTAETFSAPSYMIFCHGTYWKGGIHWAPTCVNPMYFKLDVERLEKLPMPSSTQYENGSMPLYFGECHGHFHMVESRGDMLTHMNVYEMESDHCGWFLKYQVDLDQLPGVPPEVIRGYLDRSSRYYYSFEVYSVVRGEREEDTFLVVLGFPGKLMKYNIADKSFEQIHDYSRNLDGIVRNSGVHLYIESLAHF